MLKKYVQIISLKLTVACLVCALILVFVGTLAQVNLGLYLAQEVFYRSIFISARDFASFHPDWPDWPFKGSNLSFPVFPGGILIGGTLLVNLIVSHLVLFKWTKKRIGIMLTHIGIILLLLGQMFTEMFQVESSMRIEEGQSKNYSESYRTMELAVIETSHDDFDQVTAFSQSLLTKGAILADPGLPFEIKVRRYDLNSDASVRAPFRDPPPPGLQGIGRKVKFSSAEEVRGMDTKNVPTAEVGIEFPDGQVRSWFVSHWQTDVNLVRFLTENRFGPKWGPILGPALETPQAFAYEGRQFQLWLRPVRYYKPFSIKLKEFRHDKYMGTEKAKNFSSRVQLNNEQTGERRDVLIKMNSPLRYQGETYYQSGYEGDAVTILQVVRNPSWLVPYVSCVLVGVGLAVQFLMHLFGFIKKRAA